MSNSGFIMNQLPEQESAGHTPASGQTTSKQGVNPSGEPSAGEMKQENMRADRDYIIKEQVAEQVKEMVEKRKGRQPAKGANVAPYSRLTELRALATWCLETWRRPPDRASRWEQQ